MTLEQMWREAASDLGLEIDAPYEVGLPSGTTIHAKVRLRHFGARNGMLVLADYTAVEQLTDELVAAGYGYSVLDEPGPQETYEREDFIDMLSDWGWSGTDADRPAWCEA